MSKGKIVIIVVTVVVVILAVFFFVIGRDKYVNEVIDLDSFDSVQIKISAVDLVIENGDTYKLEYACYKENIPSPSVSGGTLNLSQPSKFQMSSFKINSKEQYYKLTVPGDITDANISTSSGDITISGVNISGIVKSSSGNVAIGDTYSTELEVDTSSGKIDFENISYDKLSYSSSSGSTTITDGKVGDLNGESSSGNLKADSLTVDTVKVKNSSGNVTLNINGSQDDYAYNLSTSSGRIKVGDGSFQWENSSGDAREKQISASASSGNIDISFN